MSDTLRYEDGPVIETFDRVEVYVGQFIYYGQVKNIMPRKNKVRITVEGPRMNRSGKPIKSSHVFTPGEVFFVRRDG